MNDKLTFFGACLFGSGFLALICAGLFFWARYTGDCEIEGLAALLAVLLFGVFGVLFLMAAFMSPLGRDEMIWEGE